MLSYSRIKTFKECPKKYEYIYINGRQTAPTLQMLKGADMHIKIATEHDVPAFFKSAFEKNFPSPVFEKELSLDLLTFSLRGVIDVYSVNGSWASVADWKLWQIPDTPEQLRLYALLIAYNHDVDFVQGYYVSINGGFFKRYMFTKEELDAYIDELSELAEQIESSVNFPPRPGPHCASCGFIKDCYTQNQITAEVAGVAITSMEQAVEIARKVYLAESFLDVVKKQLKDFMQEHGIDEIVFDGENRVYLSPSIALRFGKIQKRR